MSLQSIIDISNSLTVNRRKMVGIQYTRSQLPKTDLTVTKNPWRFQVNVPGQPWNRMRPILESLDNLDRYLPQAFTFANNPNISWMFRYQGELSVPPTTLTVVSFVGNQLVLTGLPTMTVGQYLFKPGDLIQIAGYPFPFSVVNGVQYTGGGAVTITTHRPNIISANVAGLAIVVGSSCSFYMFCPNMPTYTVTPGALVVEPGLGVINNGIITFDDNFQFYEYLA